MSLPSLSPTSPTPILDHHVEGREWGLNPIPGPQGTPVRVSLVGGSGAAPARLLPSCPQVGGGRSCQAFVPSTQAESGACGHALALAQQDKGEREVLNPLLGHAGSHSSSCQGFVSHDVRAGSVAMPHPRLAG